MSDVKVQYVSATIANLSATGTATIPVSVDTSKTFLIGANFRNNASYGAGWYANGATDAIAAAELTDGTTITFRRAGTGSTLDCGVYVVTYTGAAGGANEFIVRQNSDISVGASAATGNGADITTISDVNDCVPFFTTRTEANTSDARAMYVTAQLVSSGSYWAAQLDRNVNTHTNIIYARCFVVEFTGSNWTVQKVVHAISSANTTETETVSGATPANSFVYLTWKHENIATPANHRLWSWLDGATTLRFRASSTLTDFIVYAITNPELTTQWVGTIDGTNDWTGGGQTRDVTVTSVGDDRLAICHAGSDDTTLGNNGGLAVNGWAAYYTTATNIRCTRGHSNSITDGTEYMIQSVDFSALGSSSGLILPHRSSGGMIDLSGNFRG